MSPRWLAAVLLLASCAAPRTDGLAALLDDASRDLPPAVREALRDKASPYLVKAHDVGGPNDFHKDIPWHLLEKEKDPRFKLPHAGKLGLFNTHADVNFLVGIGVGDGPINFNPSRRTLDHLVDLFAVEVEPGGGVRGHVLLLPVTSDTVLAAVDLRNEGKEARSVRVGAACEKPPTDRFPHDRFGYGVWCTTGKLKWLRESGGVALCSYEEWRRDELKEAGELLCALAATRPGREAKGLFPNGMMREYAVEVAPGGSETLLIALNLHRFGPERYVSPMSVLLYPKQTGREAVEYSANAAREALKADWRARVRESFEWYKRLPSFRFPRASWFADMLCALELPRGNTWSPQGQFDRPWYTFCRVHGHEPYGWWTYGMHGHEHLSTFVVNVTEPELSQDFLRGHFRHQEKDGYIPYGVTLTGPDRTHEKRTATCPFLMWESWNAYLWSGDRGFLREAYDAGGRFVKWWRSRDRTREGTELQHWRDVIETVRDDYDLATWEATHGPRNQEALDLNCYLLQEERTLAEMARELGKEAEGKAWDADAGRRTEEMRKRLWHEEDGVYYGRDLQRDRWARVMDVSTFFPVWSGLSTPEQSRKIVSLLRDPQTFGTGYPVATLAVKHMPKKERYGAWHWRGANWVEMTWVAVHGLRSRGFFAEAARVAEVNCRMVFRALEETSHFREYYNSLTGEPQDLTDYIWTSTPAIMAIDVFFGVRPTAKGLEVLPALPEGWNDISAGNLRVRDSRVSVAVRRDAAAQAVSATIDGKPAAVHESRGVLIPWSDLPRACSIVITQPPSIPETVRD